MRRASPPALSCSSSQTSHGCRPASGGARNDCSYGPVDLLNAAYTEGNSLFQVLEIRIAVRHPGVGDNIVRMLIADAALLQPPAQGLPGEKFRVSHRGVQHTVHVDRVRGEVAKPAQAHEHGLLKAVLVDTPEQRGLIECIESGFALVAGPGYFFKEIENIDNMGDLILDMLQLLQPFRFAQLLRWLQLDLLLAAHQAGLTLIARHTSVWLPSISPHSPQPFRALVTWARRLV